jgi:hypothetical protein
MLASARHAAAHTDGRLWPAWVILVEGFQRWASGPGASLGGAEIEDVARRVFGLHAVETTVKTPPDGVPLDEARTEYAMRILDAPGGKTVALVLHEEGVCLVVPRTP